MATRLQSGTCLVSAVLSTRKVVLEDGPADGSLPRERHAVEGRVREIYTEDHGRAFLALGLIDRALRFSPSVEFWRDLSAAFAHEVLVDPRTEELRERLTVALDRDDAAARAGRAPAMVGSELVDAALVSDMWGLIHQSYVREVSGRSEPVERILGELAPARGLLAHRVHFHLVENRRDPDAPFAFLATYSTTDGTSGGIRHLPLSSALRDAGGDTSRLVSLLSSVYKAASASALVKGLLDTGEIFQPLRFDSAEAYRFLRDVPACEDAGVLCRIPNWWHASPRRISVGLSIGDTPAGERLDADTLVNMRPLLHIDGEEIGIDEARRILARYDGLALIKGKWTAVDREELEKNLALYDRARKLASRKRIPFAEAVRILMGMESPAVEGDEKWAGSVLCGDWLKGVLDRLASPARLAEAPLPRGLKATLRPYQREGLTWLAYLAQLGFGACLADDMGLGKTIQVLAFLLARKERSGRPPGPSLLVAPASLIDNWLTEIARFAPTLKAAVAHPSYHDGKAPSPETLGVTSRDLVITTYAMARRLKWLAEYDWDCVILDEAQAIKNPGAAQTRAIKAIPARQRVLMTGTPVENRLGDLWSLFDFANSGLLGSATAFGKFARALQDHPEGYERLRRVIKPYVLRRLKTDRTIIADLPDKIELKTWAPLAKAQVVLYRGLVDEFARGVEDLTGMERRGMILAYLTRFKQVCNHPDQLAGSGAYDESGSGKMQRLREICEEIGERRERVLVFTQFREMVDPLDRFLAGVFGREGVSLHGGTAVRKRKEVVARFQRDNKYVPYFVLSVKAGGVGLNLTAANHVVHFDRWWNPAVERQAEDRAFRIGQKRNVVVHRFVCKGTVEERIDQMIESKKELSEKVLAASGLPLLTEMSNEQLRSMFTLTLTGGE